jgi:hypothetical protein
MVIQLKGRELTKLLQVKEVRALILCEGFRETEYLKAIAKRLGLYEDLSDVVVTDAEGINTLRTQVLPSILSLIVERVVMRTRIIATIIDADRMSVEDRIESLKDSLSSRGHRAIKKEHICDNVWRFSITRDVGEIHVVMAVNGVFEEPFTRFETHEFEDHILYLKILENQVAKEEIMRAKRSKELVSETDISLIENSDRNNLEKAFKHIICVLHQLTKTRK